MNKPDAWMPLHIGPYLADTTHLTTLQHGAYFLLLMTYWRIGGPLPNDDIKLARITRLTVSQWRKIKPVIVEFFQETDNNLVQKRAEIEIASANERSETARANALKRYNSPSADAEPPQSGRTAGRSAKHLPNDCSPARVPPQPLQEEEEYSPASTAVKNPASAPTEKLTLLTFHDVGKMVMEIMGVDESTWLGNYALAEVWMKREYDPALDIFPTVRSMMAKRNGTGPPSTFKYFDAAIAQAHADRNRTIKEPTNGTGRKPSKPTSIDKFRKVYTDAGFEPPDLKS